MQLPVEKKTINLTIFEFFQCSNGYKTKCIVLIVPNKKTI